MSTRTQICTECGADASNVFGQALAGSRLAWFQSTRCSACGMAFEADNYGLPPREIRAALIESTGRWGLQITANGPQRLEACKMLHCVLNATMAELVLMKRRMPGVVYTGTKTEMEWLQSRIAELGLPSAVVPQPNDVDAQSIDIAGLGSIGYEG